MHRTQLFRLASALVLFASSLAMHGQLPRDNGAWKLRCNLLQANDGAIANGHAPLALAQGTRGLPALQYMTFGFDRRQAGEHNVACTFFYMASLAAGTGSKPDLAKAKDYAEVALAEFQQARGQKVPLSERMKRFDAKLAQTRAADISTGQATAILSAASTMPVTLPPPAR